MPSGYTDAMQIFNKSLKPIFASLHELGYESSVYCWPRYFKNALIVYFPQYPCYSAPNKVYVYRKNNIFRL